MAGRGRFRHPLLPLPAAAARLRRPCLRWLGAHGIAAPAPSGFDPISEYPLPRVWFDVEDMFDYAWRYPRPSGIQRVQHELFHALAQLPEAAGRIGFVRHAPAQNALRGVAYPAVAALFDVQGAPPRQPPRRIAVPAAERADGGALRRLAYRVPPRVREPLLQLYVNQRASVGALAALARAARPTPRPPRAARAAEDAFAREAAAGDVLAVLGAAWTHPDYARVLLNARRRGLRVALLVYDLIPVFRPEWCDRGLVARFGAWIESVLPLADRVLTISAATEADLRRYAAMRGIALPEPLRIVRPGTGFTTARPGVPHPGLPRAPRLPPAGSYVLSVGTISAHKNQVLLFRVWRRLLEELPPEAVPHLVLAGRAGALVADLMQQLHNTRFLDGRVVLIEDPTDAELAQLYEGCRFTVFASLYEGWGLPVTESLQFGAPCVAANATALPEAGGALARYFDPDCATDAARVIRAAIEEADGLAGWRRQIAEQFRPVSWEAAARKLLAAIDAAI
jgi:glycosyltransferase involved in cell wall biosynthesis